MLEVRDISKNVAHRNLVGPLSFQVNQGDILAVMGPNGAGKSTLLKLVAGLMKASEGTVRWFNEDIRTSSIIPGVLSHQTYLYNALTGRENLRFYGSLTDSQPTPEIIEDILTKVGLELDADEEVSKYSRGMQQRLTIGRLLVQNPPLILLDEPQTGLDQAGIKLLCDQVGQWKEEGKSMILVTHSCDELFRHVNRLLILKKGHLAYLGECPNSPGQVLDLYQNTLHGSESAC